MAKRTQMSPYNAEDMLDHLQQLKELKEGVHKFFRYDSKFWSALHDYINKCEEGHCPFVELDHPIRHGRGMSGISWKKVYANPVGAGEDADNVIRICFDVDMWDEEWERERGASGMVDVPIKLITHFTQEEFDEWVKEREQQHDVRRLEDAKEALEKLQARYPEAFEKKGDA